MTDDEMRRYLDYLDQLPDRPDLPTEEEGETEDEGETGEEEGVTTSGSSGGGGTGRVQVEMVAGPLGRLRRVHTNGLWFAGLPELFIDPPPDFRPDEESPAGPDDDGGRLAFLLASALITLGQDLVEAEDFDLEPHHDVFRGRPVRIWLARHEAPDDELRAALGPAVDTVIRVECSLWADSPP